MSPSASRPRPAAGRPSLGLLARHVLMGATLVRVRVDAALDAWQRAGLPSLGSVRPSPRGGTLLDSLEPTPGAVRDPAASTPSQTTRAIVEALLPCHEDGMLEPVDEEVVDAVAQFVQGQLDAVAPALRWSVAGGLLGVRAITWLWHRRSLQALPLEERRRWLERWAYGDSALGRQLFRALRSTAVMAYYEQPAVAARLRDRPPSSAPSNVTTRAERGSAQSYE